jgi:hypothetical protein
VTHIFFELSRYGSVYVEKKPPRTGDMVRCGLNFEGTITEFTIETKIAICSITLEGARCRLELDLFAACLECFMKWNSMKIMI